MADAQPESMKNRKLSLKKMEALVREMMDSETGVPLRRHKLLLTAVPDAMAGYDMIEWLMEHYNLDDSSEAISLALQLCLHCFIYPVSESRDISVKDDSSIYKFHPETAWPSRGHEPDSRSYAVYLVKKQMRKDKPRLHAIDEWESEEHARLKMNLSAHWSGITVLAEEQLKLEKNRKKTEKLIAESQERAYWMVYRPPPGAPNRLEVPPYVQLRQPDRFSQRKYEAEACLEFLKNHVARSRTKVSQAAQSLVTYTTTYAEFDPVMTPPIPSNPWITDDATFWNLNSDYVEIPTERRVKRWAISSCDVLKDPTGRREFEKYLQTEYSHENIRFWMACNRLKNCTPTSLIGMRAKEIFE
ncbi:unnamed protein product [Notodromas monacha]|uniref:Regulator of G-protein signaling 7 n=1 Tax=Notodromas monacha TaxID=399045 RepID=A0A7R9GCL4_9CRUS|nr:unnamed protein product [Notodromas monacha]CAG0917572.1 unnamed protein product [Notodromas monacha]